MLRRSVALLPRVAAVVFFGSLLATFVLGWFTLSDERGLCAKLLDVLGLFLGQQPSQRGAGSPWLGWARMSGLLAALVFVGAGLGAWFGRLFRGFLAGWLLCDHVVIVGAGGAGQSLLASYTRYTRAGRRSSPFWRALVVLDNQTDALTSVRAARMGAIAIEGDAMDVNSLRRLGVSRAAGVFVATGDEIRNVEVAGRIRGLCAPSQPRRDREERAEERARSRPGRDRELRIVPVVEDPMLVRRVFEDDAVLGLGAVSQGSAKILPYSRCEEAVRLLLRRHPPAELARLTPARRPHLLIVGYGHVAEALILQGIQAAFAPDLDAPIVTVLTRDAEGARRRFELRYPGLSSQGPGQVVDQLGVVLRFEKCAREELVEEDLERIDEGICEAQRELARKLRDERDAGANAVSGTGAHWPNHPVTAIYVCHEDASRAVTAALALQRFTRRRRRLLAPTFVYLRSRSELEAALAPADRTLELWQVIETFGSDEEHNCERRLFERPWEERERELNADYERYVQRAISTGDDIKQVREILHEATSTDTKQQAGQVVVGRFGRFVGPWWKLPATARRANLGQADHVPTKLAALGAWRTRRPGARANAATLLGEEVSNRVVERLAASEHGRWMLERAADGWRSGWERDNEEGLHDLMKPWDELGPEDKNRDRAHVLLLPRYVDDRALEVVWRPEVVIGLLAPDLAAELDRERRLPDFATLKKGLEDSLKKGAEQVLADVAGAKGAWSDGPPLVCLLAPESPAGKIFVSVFLDAAKGRVSRVLFVRPFGPDVQRTWPRGSPDQDAFVEFDAGLRKELREELRTEQIEDSWVVDLLPPGFNDRCVKLDSKGPTRADRLAMRKVQLERVRAYVRQRADFLVVVRSLEREAPPEQPVGLDGLWMRPPLAPWPRKRYVV